MFSLKFCLLFVVIVGSQVKCDHVPVILWNIKGSSMPLKSISPFEANDKSMQDVIDSTLKDKSTVMVVYVEDRLSMEDLTPDKETRSTPLKTLKNLMGNKTSMMYPSIKDPTRHFREANCGVKDIHAAKHGESLEKVISNAVENSCIVIVHLGFKGLANGRQPLFKNSKKHVVGVFTASKTSWHPNEELRRKTRSLLEKPEPSHFLNFTGCGIMYADFVNISIGDLKENETVNLEFPPSSKDKDCDNKTSILSFTFDAVETQPKVIIKMIFEKFNVSWKMLNVTLQVIGKKGVPSDETNLIIPVVDVANGFSYSCGEFRMKIPSKAPYIFTVVIDRFQVQPFDAEGDFFARSFDCVPFFTLTIWMGIFVAVLFIVILNAGVYALFNIKTMDRFDDPKGKTITVPLGND